MKPASYELIPADDPRFASANAYELRRYDLALVVDSPVACAFTFGAKVAEWLAENNDIRASHLHNQIKALGTDITRLMEDAATVRRSQNDTLH